MQSHLSFLFLEAQVDTLAQKYKWVELASGMEEELHGLNPCEVAQTFSHYTYGYTKREVLVVDLQGKVVEGGQGKQLRLTDPAMHSWHSKYGRTDKGDKGMSRFFCNHRCNALCKSVGLWEK